MEAEEIVFWTSDMGLNLGRDIHAGNNIFWVLCMKMIAPSGMRAVTEVGSDCRKAKMTLKITVGY